MTNWYVYSGAAGAGTGVDWANAYTTLKAAGEAAGTASGDSIYVAHDHAETGAIAVSITFKTVAFVICVNRAGSVPPVEADLRTTGSLTTTGASTLNLATVAGGIVYFYGMVFSCGSGAVSSSFTTGINAYYIFKNCALKKLGTTGINGAITFGGKGVRLINTSFEFGSTVDNIGCSAGGSFEWVDTVNTIVGANLPTTLFVTSFSAATVLLRGLDLSVLGSRNLHSAGTINMMRVVNCKLGAAFVLTAQTVSVGTEDDGLYTIASDSAATNYRMEKVFIGSTMVTETTIVRTGGASDGAVPVSWKIVTSANSRWPYPFIAPRISIWNDTIGSKVVSIYGYWSNASPPNNDDIWIDVQFMGSTLTPIGSVVSSGKVEFISTGVAIPTDTSAWGGGATTTRFKMSVTINPQMKGPISVLVRAAKASSTFYIDPKIEVV